MKCVNAGFLTDEFNRKKKIQNFVPFGHSVAILQTLCEHSGVLPLKRLGYSTLFGTQGTQRKNSGNQDIRAIKDTWALRHLRHFIQQTPGYSIHIHFSVQKIKFFIQDFLSKCDQIRRNVRIWSHLLKKSLMENLIFFVLVAKFLDCHFEY